MQRVVHRIAREDAVAASAPLTATAHLPESLVFQLDTTREGRRSALGKSRRATERTRLISFRVQLNGRSSPSWTFRQGDRYWSFSIRSPTKHLIAAIDCNRTATDPEEADMIDHSTRALPSPAQEASWRRAWHAEEECDRSGALVPPCHGALSAVGVNPRHPARHLVGILCRPRDYPGDRVPSRDPARPRSVRQALCLLPRVCIPVLFLAPVPRRRGGRFPYPAPIVVPRGTR